jgi:glycosyltransferase involved in cell wall biosynthesis
VLVLASSAEGLPQVLVQAAAAGLPYASYDIDGTRELAALGTVGRAVAVGDRTALVQAAVAQLDHGHRPRDTAVSDATLAQWAPDHVRSRYRAEILPGSGARPSPAGPGHGAA